MRRAAGVARQQDRAQRNRTVRRREFITLFSVATVAWPLGARAQQGEKVYKIGLLTAGSSEPGGKSTVVKALRELGYVEGKNLTFERKHAEDRLDRLPVLSAELVNLKVDVIMAAGTLAPLAAKKPPRRSRSS